MDRTVKRLYGKLYMGPKLVPHYYVQFKDSEELEYVRCSEANISTAQKVAFDVNFEADERRAGNAVQNKKAEKARTSKPLTVRNLIAGPSNEKETDDDSPMKQIGTVRSSQSGTTVASQNDENDKYESSFINDSTPTFDSSSDSEPSAEAAKVKAAKKRKRAFLESDEEDSSDASPRKPAKPSSRTKHAVSGIRIKGDGSAPSKKSTSSARYTPLIILGAGGNAVEKRSGPSSPDIPVITLD